MSKRRKVKANREENAGTLNFGNIGDFINNVDIEQLTSVMSNINSILENDSIKAESTGETDEEEKGGGINIDENNGDEKEIDENKAEMLNAIKTLLNADRTELMNTLIELFLVSKASKK